MLLLMRYPSMRSIHMCRKYLSYKQLPPDPGTPFLNAWWLHNCDLEASLSITPWRSLLCGRACPRQRYITMSPLIGRTPGLMVRSSTTCQIEVFPFRCKVCVLIVLRQIQMHPTSTCVTNVFFLYIRTEKCI